MLVHTTLLARRLQACTSKAVLTSQLQLSPTGELQLTVKVHLTLANYIWLSTGMTGSGDEQDVIAFWSEAAKVLATHQHWSAMTLTSETTLLRFMGLDPAEKFPQELAVQPRSLDMPSSGWQTVPAATRTVLLMAGCVMRSHGMRRGGLSKDECKQLAAQELVHTLDQTSQTAQTASCSHSVQCTALRSALLLAKSACLLTSINMHAESLPLWFAVLAKRSELMYKVGIQASAEVQELQSLRKLLVQLVISALKVLVQLNSDAAATAASYCCTILSFMSSGYHPALYKATASQLLSSGRPLPACVKTTLASFHVLQVVMQ